MLLYCIVYYCMVLYCIRYHCMVLHATSLYCMVLYCIQFYCTVSHCDVPLLQRAGELPRSASCHFSILIVYGHSGLFWWCYLIQRPDGSSLAFVILELFGHHHAPIWHLLQLRHGIAGHGDVGLSLASKPDHSNWPVGEKINPTTNYNHLSPETVQNMFSVFSVEFTTFQKHH